MYFRRVVTVISVSLLSTFGSLAAQDSQAELRALARERLELIGSGASASQIAEVDARMDALARGGRLTGRLDRTQERVSRRVTDVREDVGERVEDVREDVDERVEDVRDTDLPRRGRAGVSASGEIRSDVPRGEALGYHTRGAGSFEQPNVGGFGVSGESSGSVRGLGAGIGSSGNVGVSAGGSGVGLGGEIGGGVGRVGANVGGTLNGAVGTGVGALR